MAPAEMELKKLHLGTMSYAVDSMDEVAHQLATAFGLPAPGDTSSNLPTGATLATRGRRDMSSRVKDVVLALGLCHNVLSPPELSHRTLYTNVSHATRSLQQSMMMARSHIKPRLPTRWPLSDGQSRWD